MSLTPWNPFADGDSFGKELSRLMNFTPFPFWGGLTSPKVDVYQTAEQVIVKAELPGVVKEDVNLYIDEHYLQLSGQTRKDNQYKDENTCRSERFFGSFSRTVPLPVQVKSEQAKAECKDGILTVTIPKAEPSQPRGRKIDIR